VQEIELAGDVNFDEIVARTEGYSGDDITNICRCAVGALVQPACAAGGGCWWWLDQPRHACMHNNLSRRSSAELCRAEPRGAALWCGCRDAAMYGMRRIIAGRTAAEIRALREDESAKDSMKAPITQVRARDDNATCTA
jgi:hypothetical protein